MLNIEELYCIVEDEINSLKISKSPKNLYDPISYIMNIGGKRMRAILLLLSNQIFSKDLNLALKPAIGIEVFHNFTLIHDDIMDNAPLRRGVSTIHEKWDANTAILSGDTMMIQSYQLMLNTPEKYLSEVLNLFSDTAVSVCEGQQFDMDFEDVQQVTLQAYLDMIEQKTAILLATSLKIGAIIGGSSKEDANDMYEFGRNIGIAFQIKDDLLDAYGDPKKFGKKIGGDIDANKKTFLFLKALELCSTTDKEKILKLFDSKANLKNKKNQVMDLYDKYEVYEVSNTKILYYHDLAIKHLNNVSGENKEPLYDFANQLLKREV